MEDKHMNNPESTRISRRDILRTTGASISYALLCGAVPDEILAQSGPKKVPTRILGRTGVPISCITLGTGHFRANLGITADDVRNMVDHCLELGVTSIDTALNYEESPEYLGQAIKPHRDHIFLATKAENPTYDGCWGQLRESMKKLQTDHFELVYIHDLGLEGFKSEVEDVLGPKGMLAALVEAKKQGIVAHIGCSAHFFPSRFQPFLKCDEIDVAMPAVNFVAKHIYNFEERVWAPAQKKNLGLIAMKILGGPADWTKGTARLSGQDYESAIRYAMELPGISSLNIGVRNLAELDRAAETVMNYKPFTDEERKQLETRGKELGKAWGAVYGEPTT